MADLSSGPPPRPGFFGSVVGRVAPVVIRQIDTNDLVDSLDLDVLAARLDLDTLLERIDINTLLERIDLDTLLERIDLDTLLERVDINDLAARLDLDTLLGRLDMAKLTAGAGQDVAVSGLDLVRRQIMRADVTVDGVVDQVLRREPGTRPEAPGRLAEDSADLDVGQTGPHELQRRDVSGHYAGPVTRALAVVADVAAVLALNAGFVAVVALSLGSILDADPSPQAVAIFSLTSLAGLFLAWFWIPVTLFARTLAMAVLGIAVVRRDGGVASGTSAFVRALVMPISLFVPILFLGLVVGKERRTLHDLAAGTTVIYDWGARDAEQPVTIREQLSARVRRREVQRDMSGSPN